MIDDPLLENGLPADVEAERVILGSILLNNGLTDQVSSILETSDFHSKSHRRIFDAMKSLSKNGIAVDCVTLSSLLRDRKELELVGGHTYVAALDYGVVETRDISGHCRIVKDQSSKRQTLTLLGSASNRIVKGEDLDSILEDVGPELSRIRESRGDGRAFTGAYSTLDAFFDAEISEPEEIIFGVHRGEAAAVVAVTNYGKTTLLCNTTLSIAGGQTCHPLAPTVPVPRRVLYIDSESPAARAQADLKRMLAGIEDQETARKNFAVVVDGSINGLPLNLSKPDHFKRIVQLAKAHKADLVVIDTVASAFELNDENSNAEVTRRVMNPLKQLAREANCAVIFTHHIGKSNETQSGEGAYRGRGASAFGALPRTTFILERDPKKGPGYVVLSCPKTKGQDFSPVLLKLNHDTRWFEICDEQPEIKSKPPSAEEIADFVAKQGEARTEDISSHFANRSSDRTIALQLKRAANLGLIEKANKQAPWRICKGKNGDFPADSEVPAESTTSDESAICNLYKEMQIADSQGNGGGKSPTYIEDEEVEAEWRA